MNEKKLFDVITHIDDDLIEEAQEAPARRKSPWVKWGALAACLCVIVAAVAAPKLLSRGETITPSIHTTTGIPEEVIYNQVETAGGRGTDQVIELFKRNLTETEFLDVAPENLREWMSAKYVNWAAFRYYYDYSHGGKPRLIYLVEDDASGDLLDEVCLYVYNREWVVPVELHMGTSEIRDDMDYGCYAVEPQKREVTRIEDTDVVFCRYDNGKHTDLWAKFTRNGVHYKVSCDTHAEVEQAQENLLQVVYRCICSVNTPDFTALQAHVPTPDDLDGMLDLRDPIFGDWIPKSIPEGFSDSITNIFRSGLKNELRVNFVGDDTHFLEWDITYLTLQPNAAERIVSPSEREKYVLAPDYMPDAPFGADEAPVFRAEELTLEMVKDRVYTESRDGLGGSDERLHFSVLFENDTLVTILAINVSPEWIYGELSAMR